LSSSSTGHPRKPNIADIGLNGLKSKKGVKMEHNTTFCRIAANMLNTEPGLLDYRLVEYLHEINHLVSTGDSELQNREVIAAAIVQWRYDKADDFTKTHYRQ